MRQSRQFALKDAVDPTHPTSRTLGLSALLRQVKNNQHHLTVVKSIVSQPIADHCSYVSLHGDSLTIVVDSAVWATRLRFETRKLKKQLHGMVDYAKIETVRIQVNRELLNE